VFFRLINAYLKGSRYSSLNNLSSLLNLQGTSEDHLLEPIDKDSLLLQLLNMMGFTLHRIRGKKLCFTLPCVPGQSYYDPEILPLQKFSIPKDSKHLLPLSSMYIFNGVSRITRRGMVVKTYVHDLGRVSLCLPLQVPTEFSLRYLSVIYKLFPSSTITGAIDSRLDEHYAAAVEVLQIERFRKLWDKTFVTAPHEPRSSNLALPMTSVKVDYRPVGGFATVGSAYNYFGNKHTSISGWSPRANQGNSMSQSVAIQPPSKS